MIEIRRSRERGQANYRWLDTHYTFSFADYYDPRFMGFRSLRVINDDRVAPGRGFPTHSHRDMEILTYVLQGALQHRDSLGNGSLIRPGDVQRMSAGTGVSHSEFNPSPSEPLHLLQIWILPERSGLAPAYEQKTFSDAEKRGKLRLVASPDGRHASLTIHQDAEMYSSLLGADQHVIHELRPGRHAWVQMASGKMNLNGNVLEEGDGAAISSEPRIELAGVDEAEVLLFDLA